MLLRFKRPLLLLVYFTDSRFCSVSATKTATKSCIEPITYGDLNLHEKNVLMCLECPQVQEWRGRMRAFELEIRYAECSFAVPSTTVWRNLERVARFPL